jgi:hypothetical protein
MMNSKKLAGLVGCLVLPYASMALSAPKNYGKFGAASYDIVCKFSDQANTEVRLNGRGELLPSRMSFFPYYSADVFQKIGSKQVYVDMWEADHAYNTASTQFVNSFDWGYGQLMTFGAIPRFAERPWNPLTASNTYPFYVADNSAQVVRSRSYFEENGQKGTLAFGDSVFLKFGAPFLHTLKSSVYGQPPEKLFDVASGRSLVVFLSKESGFLKGQGFVASSIVPNENQLISNGQLIVKPVTGMATCEPEDELR